MLRHLPVPSELHDWLEAAVVIDSPAELAQSQFPAMVASMLVVRLAGEVTLNGQAVPMSAWISGSRVARSFQHHGAVRAVGLVLRPEAAVCLLAATRGWVDTVRPMAAMAGAAWAATEQDIRSAQADEQRLVSLLQFIRHTAADRPDCHARRQQVLSLLQAVRAPASSGLTASHLGRRQFERQFSTLLGMSPKQFQLIDRHNRTLKRAAAEPGCPGVQLALDGGYCDQSHMTRDMRRFADHPLRVLLQEPHPAASEHWPLEVGAAAHQGTGSSRRR